MCKTESWNLQALSVWQQRFLQTGRGTTGRCWSPTIPDMCIAIQFPYVSLSFLGHEHLHSHFERERAECVYLCMSNYHAYLWSCPRIYPPIYLSRSHGSSYVVHIYSPSISICLHLNVIFHILNAWAAGPRRDRKGCMFRVTELAKENFCGSFAKDCRSSLWSSYISIPLMFDSF